MRARPRLHGAGVGICGLTGLASHDVRQPRGRCSLGDEAARVENLYLECIRQRRPGGVAYVWLEHQIDHEAEHRTRRAHVAIPFGSGSAKDLHDRCANAVAKSRSVLALLTAARAVRLQAHASGRECLTQRVKLGGVS